MMKRNVRFKLRPYQPKEKEEQAALVSWLRAKKIDHFAIPNGEKRDLITAIHLKRQGCVPGIPDLMIPIKTSYHAGLFIELKRRSGGVVSPSQRMWIDKLNENGYLAKICLGWDEARRIIENYLSEAI